MELQRRFCGRPRPPHRRQRCCRPLLRRCYRGRRGTQLDHRTRRYALTLCVGQCQRLASDWRRQPDRHNLHGHTNIPTSSPAPPTSTPSVAVNADGETSAWSDHPAAGVHMVRPCVHGTHPYACGHTHSLIRLRPRPHPPGHGHTHSYTTPIHLQPRPVNPAIPVPLLPPTLPPHRRQRLPPLLRRC